jgi:hypothetical protein
VQLSWLPKLPVTEAQRANGGGFDNPKHLPLLEHLDRFQDVVLGRVLALEVAQPVLSSERTGTVDEQRAEAPYWGAPLSPDSCASQLL